MISRLMLSAVLAALFFLPGCFCVSWRKYESERSRPREGTFEDDFTADIGSTHSGFSIFIQNSGPPFTLDTEYERSRPYASYSIELAELEWADGHKETLATSSDGCRVNAIKTTGYQGKVVYRAKLELPRTFGHLPEEGTIVTLRMRVIVRDASDIRVHHLVERYRFTHEKGCHAITFEALMGA